MRYLDTGDISSCVIKPAKWDLTEQKSSMEDTHLQPPHDGNISEESPTGRLGQKPENGIHFFCVIYQLGARETNGLLRVQFCFCLSIK